MPLDLQSVLPLCLAAVFVVAASPSVAALSRDKAITPYIRVVIADGLPVHGS